MISYACKRFVSAFVVIEVLLSIAIMSLLFRRLLHIFVIFDSFLTQVDEALAKLIGTDLRHLVHYAFKKKLRSRHEGCMILASKERFAFLFSFFRLM